MPAPETEPPSEEQLSDAPEYVQGPEQDYNTTDEDGMQSSSSKGSSGRKESHASNQYGKLREMYNDTAKRNQGAAQFYQQG